jgi:SPP1 gp7 family putative phage head morphogenesis protein
VAKAGEKKTSAKKPSAPLTADQIARIQAAIAALESSAYVDSLFDEVSDLVHVVYGDAAELLDVTSSVSDVPPVWAIDHVKDAADHVGSLIEERDKAALTAVLEDALTAGLSSRDTATALKDSFETIRTTADDGAVREQRSDSWFTTVARTELQRAANAGQTSLYEAAGVEKVRWQAAEPCDECAPYDDEVYALDDVPEGGPPLHPNCRCVLAPADEDLGSWRGTDEERAAARPGNAPEESDDGE